MRYKTNASIYIKQQIFHNLISPMHVAELYSLLIKIK